MTVVMLLMMATNMFLQVTMEISAYEFLVEQAVVNENVSYKDFKVEETTTYNITKETEPARKTSQSVFFLKKPVKGGVTTSEYGDMVDRSGPHIGHDWAVGVGTSVVASADGTVVKAYYSESYGYNIVISHKNGMETRYAHLSKIEVNKGAKVKQGQLIGYSGNTGQSTGPHLHFEVIINGKKEDPLNYIK